LVHEPQWKQCLKDAELLDADERQHERKKPGQPGARRKFQWVKR